MQHDKNIAKLGNFAFEIRSITSIKLIVLQLLMRLTSIL